MVDVEDKMAGVVDKMVDVDEELIEEGSETFLSKIQVDDEVKGENDR